MSKKGSKTPSTSQSNIFRTHLLTQNNNNNQQSLDNQYTETNLIKKQNFSQRQLGIQIKDEQKTQQQQMIDQHLFKFKSHLRKGSLREKKYKFFEEQNDLKKIDTMFTNDCNITEAMLKEINELVQISQFHDKYFKILLDKNKRKKDINTNTYWEQTCKDHKSILRDFCMNYKKLDQTEKQPNNIKDLKKKHEDQWFSTIKDIVENQDYQKLKAFKEMMIGQENNLISEQDHINYAIQYLEDHHICVKSDELKKIKDLHENVQKLIYHVHVNARNKRKLVHIGQKTQPQIITSPPKIQDTDFGSKKRKFITFQEKSIKSPQKIQLYTDQNSINYTSDKLDQNKSINNFAHLSHLDVRKNALKRDGSNFILQKSSLNSLETYLNSIQKQAIYIKIQTKLQKLIMNAYQEKEPDILNLKFDCPYSQKISEQYSIKEDKEMYIKKDSVTPRDAYNNLERCITNQELNEIEDKCLETIDNLNIESQLIKKNLQSFNQEIQQNKFKIQQKYKPSNIQKVFRIGNELLKRWDKQQYSSFNYNKQELKDHVSEIKRFKRQI